MARSYNIPILGLVASGGGIGGGNRPQTKEEIINVTTGKNVYPFNNDNPSAYVTVTYFGLEMTKDIDYNLNNDRNQITWTSDVPLESGEFLKLKY